ncbi:MAG: UPF0758 domain-containing protein [Planctomycetota bacterium]
MSKAEDEKRRTKLREVLSIAASKQEFDRDEIVSLCNEARSAFVGNVLKQLASDAVISYIPGENYGTTRYTWIVNRDKFDSDSWIHQQIHSGNQVQRAPKEERPRERLLQLGAERLKTSELLAILIRSGLRGESAVQSGQRVASHFEENLERMAEHSPSELKAISKAVSEVAYCQIMAGIELGRRIAESRLAHSPKIKINSTKSAIEYCSRHFARLAQDARQEEFHIVTLDTKTGAAASKSPPRQQTRVASLPTIMDTSDSPHPPPRLSNEHHVGGHDLVSHLHGLSPNPSGLPVQRLSRPCASRPLAMRTSNIPFDEDDCWET